MSMWGVVSINFSRVTDGRQIYKPLVKVYETNTVDLASDINV